MTRFSLHATPIRLALTYMAIFALSVLVLAITTYVSVQRSLDQQLRVHIETEMTQLLVDYYEEGVEELRHDIAENIESSGSRRMHYTLVSPSGRAVFDRLVTIPDTAGWHYLENPQGKNLLVNQKILDNGYRLLVGHELESLAALQKILRKNFIIALVLTFFVGMIGSIIISRRFVARINRFEQAAKKIGRGALSERLPLSGSADTFDGIAETINTMLDRIEQLVGQIRHVSSNIAHDMRTPLGRIRLRLEEMEESLRDMPIQQQACRETLDMLDESLEVFASILRISHIESGGPRTAFKTFDLSRRLGEIADIFKPVAEDQSITLNAHIQDGIDFTGDETLLSQAFVNVIENALTHAQDASTINISMHKNDNHLRITFADNGIGVPQEKFSLLTQAFFRMDNSRSTKGNGLGLHLVAAIAQLHDGTITFEDNRNGLRVILSFPV